MQIIKHVSVRCPKSVTPLILIVLFAWLPVGNMSSRAQVAPLSDQYLINPFQANPAIAGTERYMPLRISARQQWIGLQNSPATQSISLHKRFRSGGIRFTPGGFVNKGKNSFGKVGMGGTIFTYSYGAISHTGISVAYSYHAFVGRGRLAFGLAPVFFQYSLNKHGFILPDGNNLDPLISEPNESLLFLDVNAGMHYYDKKGYAGFSVVQMLNSGVQFGDLSFVTDDRMSLNSDLSRTMYAYYGTYLHLSRDVMLEPSVWVKFNEQSGIRLDINAILNLQEVFQAGLSYRLMEGAGVIAGVRLDNLMIRYYFEIPMTNQMPNRFTSHQIMINFNLGQPLD